MIKRLILCAGTLLATSTLLTFAPRQASAIPWTNDGSWKSAFTSSDFRSPEITALIRRYKQPQVDYALASQLASYGADVVPYMARLSGDRAIGVYFLNPYLGVFGVVKGYPYLPHAEAVLSRITDPKAIPNLKKLLPDKFIGSPIRDVLLKLNSSFTKEEVQKAIDMDARNWLVGGNLKRQYIPMMERLSPDEKADLLFYMLDPHKLFPLLDFSNGNNAHSLSGNDIDVWMTIIAQIGATGSPAAFDRLYSQYEGISNAHEDRLGQMSSKERMTFYTDSGRGAVAHDTDIYKRILPIFEDALAKLTAAKKVAVGHVIPPIGRKDQSWKGKQVISFQVWGNSPQVQVTASVGGAPITDVAGNAWSSRLVSLDAGKNLAFQKTIQLVWAPNPPTRASQQVEVRIVDRNGNISTKTFFGGAYSE